jgi:hypothetical protein
MTQTIHKILDNRWVQRIVLPIAIFNFCRSFIRVKKEQKILREVINNNDEFFKALGQLGFKPDGHFGELISIQPFEPGLKLEDINAIAQKTIIGVITKFVKDENLLGIINVDCRLDKQNVLTTIRPTTTPVLLGDLYDAFIASLVTGTSILFYSQLFY